MIHYNSIYCTFWQLCCFLLGLIPAVLFTSILSCLGGLEGGQSAPNPAEIGGAPFHLTSPTPVFVELDRYRQAAVGISGQSETSYVQEL